MTLATLSDKDRAELLRRLAQGFGLDYNSATADDLLQAAYDHFDKAERYRALCQ